IFHRHLLRPSSLLDLANLSKFAAISAMYWDIKSRRQKFKNLPARGIDTPSFSSIFAKEE
ncbi:MAG: hypothetical protein LW832_03520, partial [Parachlamydia sp.]|nr:hypothetical protein [Parachlamydia sp.]